jgi:hypothetical protein
MRQKHIACAKAALLDGRLILVSSTAAEQSKVLARTREMR